MKKSILLTVLFISILILVGSISLVSAALNLKITGVINDYNADLWIKDNANAGSGFDPYDFLITSSPNDYSTFSSTVSGNSLAIDSWSFGSTSRTFNLVYHVSSAQTGTFGLSWSSGAISSGTYDVDLEYYGTDSSYATQVGSDVDMSSSSSYTSPSLDGESDIYVRVIVAPPATTTSDETTSSSSSGGGGGGTVVQQPDVIISLDLSSPELLFDASIVLTDKFRAINEGDIIESQITLLPMIVENPQVDVTLSYSIKNFEGREFPVGESETILVTGQKSFKKQFATSNLPPGNYILSLELKYPTGITDGITSYAIATSTSQFEVKSKEFGVPISQKYKSMTIILGVGIFFLILLIIVVLISYKKIKKKK